MVGTLIVNVWFATFSLRLGSTAPNFKAETTAGIIDFHEWIGDQWAILFSHPEDYTPVCTTELAALAKYEPEFTKRGVKLIGLSANTVESHGGWINDIDGKYRMLPKSPFPQICQVADSIPRNSWHAHGLSHHWR